MNFHPFPAGNHPSELESIKISNSPFQSEAAESLIFGDHDFFWILLFFNHFLTRSSFSVN